MLQHLLLINKMKEKKIKHWGKYSQSQLQSVDSDEEDFTYQFKI